MQHKNNPCKASKRLLKNPPPTHKSKEQLVDYIKDQDLIIKNLQEQFSTLAITQQEVLEAKEQEITALKESLAEAKERESELQKNPEE